MELREPGNALRSPSSISSQSWISFLRFSIVFSDFLTLRWRLIICRPCWRHLLSLAPWCRWASKQRHSVDADSWSILIQLAGENCNPTNGSNGNGWRFWTFRWSFSMWIRLIPLVNSALGSRWCFLRRTHSYQTNCRQVSWCKSYCSIPSQDLENSFQDVKPQGQLVVSKGIWQCQRHCQN